MTKRSPITVVLLSVITFGIYALVWQVQTKNELNKSYAAGIPTAWLILVPIVGALYWMWKWSEGAEKATGTSAISVFLLMALIPIVGIPVMVGKFNDAKPAIPFASVTRMAA
jgi:cytochrome bd-type quinol oxidase subunit 2